MKKETKKKSNPEWVDIHDDDLMVELGLRQPLLEQPKEYVRTAKEKKYLKMLSRTCKMDDTHFHSTPGKHIPVYTKMIVYLKKNDKFPNTTYSMICGQGDIDSVLSFYRNVNKKGYEENLVTKYVFNGKTYQPTERPFWF